jgi:F0F1-type ATP synthase membrane subunit c/vacuolar-type H+-ATPase subunit K
MTLSSRVLLLVVGVLIFSPAFVAAQADVKSKEAQQQAVELAKATNNGTSGAGMGMGLAIVGAGVGIGLIGFAALSGIARQPEQAGKIQGAMYVLAALVEGAAIIALLLCFVVAARIMG